MKFKIVFSAAEKESRHEAAARFVISRKPKPTRSLAVSYTHLDVYKRQDHFL